MSVLPRISWLILGVTVFVVSTPRVANSLSCKGLTRLDKAAFSVLEAERVPSSGALPAHCRVHGVLPPAVHFELRLPEPWNGKFLMVGNGGYLGMFFDQSYGLGRGYATASTDTGHSGPDPKFAFNNREAELDFAYRAVHVTAQAARQLIEKFYGRGPQYAYFRGCSTGGRQGLMEAQRFPDDFDGWSIGAPLYDYTDKQTFSASWVAHAMFADNRKGYVPRTKLKALGKSVLVQCDAIDGLEDGLIDDPRRCDFDPQRHLKLCPDAQDQPSCFSEDQIEAISKIYTGPPGGQYPGLVKGGEWMAAPAGQMTGGWDTFITGVMRPGKEASNAIGQMDRDPYGGNEFMPVQMRNAMSFFKYLAFEQDRPEFDVLVDLDFAHVPDTSFMARMMNADNTDLGHLQTTGKKMILWHGWADVGLNPLRTIQYFESVQMNTGVEAAVEFLRLFMVPGMYHCEGGPGPDLFDDLGALEAWVENGVAPERMDAFKTIGANDFYPERHPAGINQIKARLLRSRPLCSYPKVARYRGQGSKERAVNFSCVNPPH